MALRLRAAELIALTPPSFSPLTPQVRGKGAGTAMISATLHPPTHTHAPALLLPTTMRPSRSLMSARSEASASTAMISEATAMSKPVERSCPRSSLPCPTVMARRNLHGGRQGPHVGIMWVHRL